MTFIAISFFWFRIAMKSEKLMKNAYIFLISSLKLKVEYILKWYKIIILCTYTCKWSLKIAKFKFKYLKTILKNILVHGVSTFLAAIVVVLI